MSKMGEEVSTKKSNILKQTCNWKLRVCLSMHDLLVDTSDEDASFKKIEMQCFARFGTICTSLKTWQTPIDEVYFQ